MNSNHKKLITNPLGKNNPITVQVLGICSCLAVTAQLKPAVVMALSVTVVVALSNLIISLMRRSIPPRIRIIVQLVVVSALVILVNQVLMAFVYDVSKQLSVYVGLIITNCIVMGRLEAFAMSNRPWPAFLDGIGNGLGYGIILVILGFVRELFGRGTLWGYPVFEKLGLYNIGYENNGFIIMAPMALILVGVIIWIQRTRDKDLCEYPYGSINFNCKLSIFDSKSGIFQYIYQVDLHRQYDFRFLLGHVQLSGCVEDGEDLVWLGRGGHFCVAHHCPGQLSYRQIPSAAWRIGMALAQTGRC